MPETNPEHRSVIRSRYLTIVTCFCPVEKVGAKSKLGIYKSGSNLIWQVNYNPGKAVCYEDDIDGGKLD